MLVSNLSRNCRVYCSADASPDPAAFRMATSEASLAAAIRLVDFNTSWVWVLGASSLGCIRTTWCFLRVRSMHVFPRPRTPSYAWNGREGMREDAVIAHEARADVSDT
eukprot:scaffold2848_cov352-Pavlova_lutheri.AAC.32